MISQAVRTALAFGAALAAAPAVAQAGTGNEAASVQATAPDQTVGEAGSCCVIPALTPVTIEVVEAVTSRTSRSGDRFAIRLAEPLVVDGSVLAPAGTLGVGEVVHAAKARGMGKAGELILAARYLELPRQRIPLRSFQYGKRQGRDSSGATSIASSVAGAVLPAASVVGLLVSGGEIEIPAGTRADAKIAADTHIPLHQ